MTAELTRYFIQNNLSVPMVGAEHKIPTVVMEYIDLGRLDSNIDHPTEF
jgi:hypothetical protein